ncbi:hypothetical protein [Carnobacterium funditum]|uniref:hypothetical protein n=1 Tax=Carnobacterium funditum TaxID=2752 RepID=UPI00068CFAE8|nr:hypothetical protein [Carnobacterium funditum]
MTDQEKSTWIYNKTLTQKDNQHGDFLDSLKTQLSLDQKISEVSFSTSELKSWQSKIEKREIYYECVYYELYDEDYWDREEGYEYNDPFGINLSILKALQTAKEWAAAKQYQKAADLYDWLCTIPFGGFDSERKEWLDEELDLERLVEEQVVQVELKQIGVQLLYAHYQALPMEKRPACFFRYLSWEMFGEIKIENVFSLELKDVPLFIEKWIVFLRKTSGDRAGELLTEACLFSGGINRLCEEAEKNAAMHPILFENASKFYYDNDLFLECERIGLKAIDKLAENLVVRNRIAELTIKVALQLDHKDQIAKLYEAAFHSHSTVPTYLRLFRLPDYEVVTKRAANYAKSVPNLVAIKVSNAASQLNENGLSAENKQLIRFLIMNLYLFKACVKETIMT